MRKEAANVLTELYVNQKVTPCLNEMMYMVMSTAAMDDLHWEVQLAALEFWRHAIKFQLSDRGMIDGKFPSVTFSKEKRKIIVLNDREIEKILISIMNDLSANGCLTVLHKCLNEEWNTDVMELAYSVVNDLVQTLDCYRIVLVPGKPRRADRDSNPDSRIGANDVAMDLCSPLHDTDSRNAVIETIVNTNDADLVSELHNMSDGGKANLLDCHNLFATTKPVEYIDPFKFIESFKAVDYLAIIDSKKKWHNGPRNLDTLLDDILTLGEDKKLHFEECNE